ncbi:MAG: DUF3408 domain-containing protein [Tannerellaceae bacterium]|nr:DUF3408 domain-containing protein [Tannerellaceae bacterium]
MNSKQANSERERVLKDYLPASPRAKTASSEPTAKVDNVQTEESTKSIIGNGTGDSVYTKDTVDATKTKETEATMLTAPRRISGKQRKESLEEYRETFLQVPKLEDRKPVFVSCEVRDRLDEIARRLGGRKMSVSGLIENLVRHHLEIYNEDFEVWKKL